MNNDAAYTNQLIHTTSPYLQQHAHNPVDWYPWGPEALDKARVENKLILLSIGYSACHWCHVMAHESFEDPETAELMNALFVNVKVDREERPDLDKIYQVAHQMLAQRPGGWPLTMFLTPDDHTPFFGGTYFPKDERHGLPAFKAIMHRIVDFYQERRDDIKQQNASLVTALHAMNPTPEAGEVVLNGAPLESARQQLAANFDERHGGFGRAPKFPHPTSIERLLRHWAASRDAGQASERTLEMATVTLRKMALGGMNDQLGGGFCRYSVDDLWMIPHFEKMLYDNGPLLCLYSDAWQATGEPLFKKTVEETAAWGMREMQSPEGGYYSSLDADSEGEEGKFYAWTRDEVKALLSEEEYSLFARRYGLDRPANFEGKWHLHTYRDTQALNREFALPEAQIEALIDSARQKLLRAREQRVHPGRDEKILTSWNGLMIKGMARAGRLLQRPEFIHSAELALTFIHATLWEDGRLLATYKDGKAHLPAYLDDYAYLIDGILELLQARWNRADLAFAQALAEVLLTHFEDQERGGFFFTADDHEALIHRPKPLSDDSTPSGNGIAAHVLGRLGHLLGEPRYVQAAERTLKLAWASIQASPYAYTTLLLALEEHLNPPQTLVLRGKPDAMAEWEDMARATYAPRRLCFAIPGDATDLPELLKERVPRGKVTAYVCTGTTCSAPADSLEAFAEALKST